MKRIIGIDPGPERSAYAVLADGVPGAHGWIPNEELLRLLPAMQCDTRTEFDCLAIETLHPRAEPVSLGAMLGQLWAGRFIQAAGQRFVCVDTNDARFNATGNPQARDKHLRAGLFNIFGEDKQEPCGCNGGRVNGKRAGTSKICPRCKGERFVTVPGPVAGHNEHERSALAAALYVFQLQRKTVPA